MTIKVRVGVAEFGVARVGIDGLEGWAEGG